MGGACGTYGGREVHRGFSWEKYEEKRQLGGLDVDGMRILKRILKKQDGGQDWIDLAQDRQKWRALVNAAVNLLFPYNERNFLTSC
jgi:hypothetical protein